MKIYLTRHGETEWNIQKRMQGVQDSPLTAFGLAQAEKLRPWIAEVRPEIAYVSPLLRALKTAEITLSGQSIPIECDKRLREIELGAFEGETFKGAFQKYPSEMDAFMNRPEEFRPVGGIGESFSQTCARVNDFLNHILVGAHQSVLVVAHSVILLAARVVMLNLPINELRKGVKVHSCCRWTAEYENGRLIRLDTGDPNESLPIL